MSIVKLFAPILGMLLLPGLVVAQRQPVLRQIKVPHSSASGWPS
jgi:hypothetical protein